MTETLVAVSSPSMKSRNEPAEPDPSAVSPPAQPETGGLLARPPVDAGAVPLVDQEPELARELVRQARASGMALTGPGGLLKSVTKLVIETALEEEMNEHLGYDKHAMEGRNRGNSRNGKRSKILDTPQLGLTLGDRMPAAETNQRTATCKVNVALPCKAQVVSCQDNIPRCPSSGLRAATVVERVSIASWRST
jgi:hypothetical protein